MAKFDDIEDEIDWKWLDLGKFSGLKVEEGEQTPPDMEAMEMEKKLAGEGRGGLVESKLDLELQKLW